MKVQLDGGEVIDLGTTETMPTIGIVDYSRRVTDDFGVTTVVERGFARRMSARLMVPFDSVDALQRRLARLRATSALWVADDRFDWLSVRGFYKDFALDLSVPPTSYCTLEIEGLASSETVADGGADPAADGKASTLQLLRPAAVTDSVLTSSSISETDAAQWVAATSYALGAHVIRGTHHRIYESLVAANVGNDPAGTSGKWLDIGPTNRWAMFDQALGTVTSATSSIAVTLSAGTVNAVALLDVIATSVRVQSGAYDRTLAAGAGAITFLDLPTTSAAVTVTITGSGTISVGTLLIGNLVGLGITEAAPTAGITDYSRKEVDDFGEATIVQRAWAKRMSARALIRTDALDLVANRIAAVRAQPALWIGQAGLDSLTIYGFFKDFSIEVADNVSVLSLSVEGLSTAAPVVPPTVAAAWPDVTDPTGTKPQDNATDGAVLDPTAAHGALKDAAGTKLSPDEIRNDALSLAPDGRLLAYGRVAGTPGLVQLARGQITLPDLGAASDASRRKLETGLDTIAQAIARLAVDHSATRATMRDAGIAVDPASGTVTLYANEQLGQVGIRLAAAESKLTLAASRTYVDEQLLLALSDPSAIIDLTAVLARVTSLEIELDAAEGTIASKAASTTVTALDSRVTSAESTLSALPSSSSIRQEVSAARYVADTAGQAVLRALLAGDGSTKLQQVAIANARQELTAKIVDDVSAEASLRVALAVRVGGVEALVATETLARASADAALASTITTLQGTVTTNAATAAAAVTTEQSARISAVSAVSASLTDLTATVTTNAATAASAVSNEASARTTADGTIAANLSSLTSTYNSGIAAANSGIATNAAAITGANAALATESSTRASADSAISVSLASLTSTVTTNASSAAAAVTSEASSRTTADSALGVRIDNLTSTVTTNASTAAAAVSAETSARSTAVSAVAADVATLSATVTTNASTASAAVSTEATARAAADSTIAGNVSTISTTLAGHTSTLTAYGSSIDGLKLKYGVEYNSDGQISGFVLNGGGGRTDALFAVDSFKLAAPGSSTAFAAFDVAGGVLYLAGALKVNSVDTAQLTVGGVTTSKIADYAVSNSFGVEGGDVGFGTSAQNGPSGSMTSRDGGHVMIWVTGTIQMSTAGPTATVRLFRNGTNVLERVVRNSAFSFNKLFAGSGGTDSWQVTVAASAGYGSGDPHQLIAPTLAGLELAK